MSKTYLDTVTDEEFNPEDLPVQVCSSGGGYYIGQLEPCGAPFCRLSGYYKSRSDAEKALQEGWAEHHGSEENKPVLEALESAGKLTRGAVH